MVMSLVVGRVRVVVKVKKVLGDGDGDGEVEVRWRVAARANAMRRIWIWHSSVWRRNCLHLSGPGLCMVWCIKLTSADVDSALLARQTPTTMMGMPPPPPNLPPYGQ